MKNRLFPAVAAISLISACGGGGGGGSLPASPSVGYFVDSAVQGLDYSTPTQAGKTDATGSFNYLDGESVSFELYGKEILAPKGFTYLTPFDVESGEVNTGYSVNLTRFLIALDSDNDPSNGITLPDYAGAMDVDFDRSIRDFELDTDGKLRSALNAIAPGRGLPTVQAAAQHLSNTLASIDPAYTLNLVGKTATSTLRNSFCSNDLTLGWRYTFNADNVTLVGDDTFVTDNNSVCTPGGEEELVLNYSDDIEEGEFLDCAPRCTWKQLNRVTHIPSDTDGREAIVWSWHTPNTNKIISVKTILSDPASNNAPASLGSFVEVVTLD